MRERAICRGAQFACFTGTKVHILTLRACRQQEGSHVHVHAGSGVGEDEQVTGEAAGGALSLLLVQRYLLYQYKSTNTDSSGVRQAVLSSLDTASTLARL